MNNKSKKVFLEVVLIAISYIIIMASSSSTPQSTILQKAVAFHQSRNLTSDEANTVDKNAFGIIASCKAIQDSKTTHGSNCDSFIQYLNNKCKKFVAALDYCSNNDLILYTNGVILNEHGVISPGQKNFQINQKNIQIEQEEQKKVKSDQDLFDKYLNAPNGNSSTFSEACSDPNFPAGMCK
ncbi:MAG TPA: hypothetical protein VE089_06820 [Nitrososphaeraceae archaeon]|jgi:hypothetical protein|nr:hypothetical protein [Nitrososphaeraceae archaeon]